MIVSAIAAAACNWVIGDGDDIPWRLSTDLKYFKRMTSGRHIIMGRKTFETLPRPLPNRTNIIITRDPFYVATGTIVVHTLEEALQAAAENGEEEAFIVGGGEIYRIAMPYYDRIYLTEVDAEPKGDITFPEFPKEEWKEISREEHQADERNDHDFAFVVYERLNRKEASLS